MTFLVAFLNKMIQNTKFLFVGFIVVICSCSNPNEKHFKIGFSQTGINDEWRKSMNQAMEIQAGFYPEFELKILNSEDDIENQIKNIEQLISEKVDILIV